MADLQILNVTVAKLAEKIHRYRDKVIGEQNTKASLIDPMLECLGWDTRDFDSVHREYRTKNRDKPVDYALKLLRRPRLFIEAKGLGENLSDRKWISQVLGYATVAGVEWCVLTDGNEYRIYNATAAVDAEEKLFRKVRIADEEGVVVSSTLHLISRENLEENLLDVHWKAHFVDRRVKAGIEEMIESAQPGFIRLIRKRVPSLTAKAVADSLARLDVKIEPPAIPIVPVGRGRMAPVTPRAAKGPRDHRRSSATTTTPESRRSIKANRDRKYIDVTLSQLIAAGILNAPLVLSRKYKGRHLEAQLLPDGSIQFGGKTYDSSSLAGEQARSAVTGRPMNTNGWIFWRYDDGGVMRKLDYARQEFLRGRQPSPPLRLTGSDFRARPNRG